MTAIQVIENPAIEGKRRALVLAEDRVGHSRNSVNSSSGSSLSVRTCCRAPDTCGRPRE
jgi:hypothetical protein